MKLLWLFILLKTIWLLLWLHGYILWKCFRHFLKLMNHDISNVPGNHTLFHWAKSILKKILTKDKYWHNQLTETATRGVLLKKIVLKNVANVTGKNLCWSLFLIKLQAWYPITLLKRDSKTVISRRIWWNFQQHLFWRTSANGCFWIDRKVFGRSAYNKEWNIPWLVNFKVTTS